MLLFTSSCVHDVSPVSVWRPIRKVMAEKDDNRLLVEYLTVNWKDLKKRNEVEISGQLLSFFYLNDHDQFQKYLQEGVTKLLNVYRLLPKKQIPSEVQVRKNERITFLFEEMLRKEGSSKFLETFLAALPIVNDQLNPQDFNGSISKKSAAWKAQPNRAIHIAIRGGAFGNVKFLLSLDDIDVNALWKLQTPLMMLFGLVESSNFSHVLELVEILAVKQADINIGDRDRHPLSVICQNGKVSGEQKQQLLMVCSAKFDCDVDDLYEGRTRKDIEKLAVRGPSFGRTSTHVSLRLLEVLIVMKKDAHFSKKFGQYKSSDLKDLYHLLELATARGRYVCVETIFDVMRRSEEFVRATDDQMALSKELRVACQNGFARVQRLLLNNIKTSLDNEYPLLLGSVKELHRSRTLARLECFKLFVEDRRILVEKGDEEGQTALHFAAQHGMDQEALDIMIKRTPYLGQINRNNKTMLHLMNPGVLDTFLDSRLTMPASSRDDLHLNLSGLLPARRKFNTVDSEIDLFCYMAETLDFKPMLRHPAVGTFIQVKYLFMRWIFYGAILISVLFAICFNIYAIWNNTVAKVFCCILLPYFIMDTVATITADIVGWLNQGSVAERSKAMVSGAAMRWIEPWLEPWMEQIKRRGKDQPQQRQKEFDFLRNFDSLHVLNKYRGVIITILAIWSFVNNNVITMILVILLSAVDVVVHLLLIPSITLSMGVIKMKSASKTFLKLVVVTTLSFVLSLYLVFTTTHINDNILEFAQTRLSPLNTPNNHGTLYMAPNNDTDFVTNDNSTKCLCPLPRAPKSNVNLWSMIKPFEDYEDEYDDKEDKPDYDDPGSDERTAQPGATFVAYLTIVITMVISNLVHGSSNSLEKLRAAEADSYAKWLDNLRRFERILSFRFFDRIRDQTTFLNRYQPRVTVKTKLGGRIILTKSGIGKSLAAAQQLFNIVPRWMRFCHGMDGPTLTHALDIVLKRTKTSFVLEERGRDPFGELRKFWKQEQDEEGE